MREEHQQSLGAQIAALRERQGWSQRALAKWVGLDQSAVSRIEAGRRRLSAEELHRFADALHVTADVLLRGEPPESLASGPRPTVSRRLPAEDGPLDTFERAVGSPLQAQMEPAARMSRMALRASDDSMEDAESSRLLTGRSRLLSMSAPPQPLSASGPGPAPENVPQAVAAVAADWLRLRSLTATDEPAQRWSTGHSAEGKPERLAHPAAGLRPGLATGDVLYDRVARFWRSELHVEPDDGPLPDLVPLLEDGYGAQVIVARVAGPLSGQGSPPASERPVAATFTHSGVPFVFVNAARPVLLQRFALAHAFAHLVLGHGDVTDLRIEWSRNIPPEAAANDFAEEFLAPVRAVQRWYERRETPRAVRLEDLLDLGNAFGISAWSALFRSRAAGRLQGKQFHVLRGELKQHEWELLPRQAYLGGIRDTLTHLTPGDCLPPGRYGGPAVLRVPAVMRSWALTALRSGRLSVEDAATLLRVEPPELAGQLARLGLE
jgi:transcriptional regulator with XRE-family HTH domain